jgi:molybdenum cofactor cytidylyltransferase
MRAAGVVLAAGRSQRMGTPKAMLRVDERSFLERTVTALREGGCETVVVVAGPQGDADADAVAVAAGGLDAAVARNRDGASEQLASLRLALATLPDGVGAAVVLPVDAPTVGGMVVAALLARWRQSGAPVVLPACGGRHGHPALFDRAVWPEFSAPGLTDGARSVIRAHEVGLQLVEVGDAGVLVDIDTPEQYRRLIDGTQ